MTTSNYETRYLDMLERSYSFLQRKIKSANGSPINQTVHDFIIESGGKCLHCGINLTRKNSNTEHIHDLALGGLNRSPNKIIMCRDCNLSRNKTMQTYLGAPSYWRGFPGNWDRVKNYLLWNAITVDEGHNAGIRYPDVHRIFESILADNRVRVQPPKVWHGRGGQGRIFQRKKAKTGFWTRFFDRIFGYSPKNSISKTDEYIGYSKKDLNDETNKAKAKIEVDEIFKIRILNALSSIDGEIKLATFSNYFQLYLVSQGCKKQSLKEFARSFGIPKKRSCIEIIDDYFPDEIGYRREGETIVYIWMKNRGVFVSPVDEEE